MFTQILYLSYPVFLAMGHRKEKRFNIRARLFVGSLPGEVDEDWLKELFKPHSDVSEVFLHREKGFGFVRCVSDSKYRFTGILGGFFARFEV